MEILRAHISNILSIEDITIEFETTGLVLIDGWSYDDNRANGAGKSAIFNAISFGIFDKLPRKITKSEILKKGTNKGFAYVEIKVNNTIYAVRRHRPTNVEYFINGVKSEITQEEFENSIGLTYRQFLITMYTAQNTNEKFIFLNDNGKKDFILEVMKLATFNDFHSTSKKMITELERNIADLTSDLKNYKSQIDIYKESIVNDNELTMSIKDHLKEISKFNQELIKLQTIPCPDVSKYFSIEQKISEANSNFAQMEMQRDQYMREYQQNKSISELPFIFHKPQPDAECPDCKAPLVIQGKTLSHVEDTTAHEKTARTMHEERTKIAKDLMVDLLIKIENCNNKLSDRNKINNLEQKLIEQKRRDFKDYDNAQSKISEYQRCISSRNQSIQYLKEKQNTNIIVLEKIKKLISEAKQVKQQLLQLEDELDTVKFCAQVFAPTGAPAYIMDGLIDMFNEAVSEYIQMIWPSATYQLQTHKVNSDKTIVAKFSEELIIDNKSRSIGSMSGGELRSLSLALDFAILDVLVSQYGTNINPIILDEPFEGLDAVGREIVIDLLQRIAQKRQIIVIDHMSESKTLFSKIIKVEKKNGTSNISTDSVG